MIDKDLVLKRAIITAPTRKEAKWLDAFFACHGYNVRADVKWGTYKNDTCYNWDGFNLCYCWQRWYEEIDPEEQDWWPENPDLVFISVDDYITYCEGESKCEIDMQIPSLDGIL